MAVKTMNRDKRLAAWDSAIEFQPKLSATAARALLKLEFSDNDKSRMRELTAKARRGSLTQDESVEIETYEQMGSLLDILHSKARRVLNKGKLAS